MARSYADMTTLDCPSCGQPFHAEIWLIVDTTERLDLVERIQQGTAHLATCPQCGHQIAVEAPLRHYQADAPRAAPDSRPGTNVPQPEAYRGGGTLGLCLRIRLLIAVERASRRLKQVCRGIGGRLTEFGDRLLEISDRLAKTGEISAPVDLAAFQREWLRVPNNPAEIPQFIERYQQVWLPMVERGSNPALRGMVHYKLALAFTKTPEGERADNLEWAIEHYNQALQITTRQADPARWAAIQNDLATAYAKRIRGERADNLERAIEHYNQALEVRTRQAFPVVWAMTQNNLANVYYSRIRGERADNLEQAIEHYTQALEVRTRQADPADWAATQVNLANACADRINGERADNLERAIEHCTLALEVYTRQAFPERWATTQNNLGAAYRRRIRGERADNLERAIEHCTLALEVRTRQAFPADWAATQVNLGAAYYSRIRGERADNLERAIAHYTQALEVYTRQAFPERWATTQNNLGEAYRRRIRGERAENQERAIEHYTLALEVYTRQAFPADWAMTQNNLANAYGDRIRGERAENLERAIEHYTLALEVYTRQAFPTDWAATQHNLGLAYTDRIRGERAENLERAIEHYTLALEVRTHQAHPADWAMTQNGLAATYADRIRGERADNLERAIEHYTLALEVYTHQAFPADWATTQNNLANAYRRRIHGERSENLERAIEHYNQTLQVYTRQADPERWAGVQNNLANAYQRRIQGERADNLERAIEHYTQALEVRTRQTFPAGWAMTQNNLANACGDRIRGDRAENLERAIEHYTQALEVYTLKQLPADHLRTMRNLANLYFDMQNWQEAYEAYDAAVEAGDLLLGAAYTEVGRQAEVVQTSRLHACAAYALLRMERCTEALLTLEQGKTRLLSEALALADADLAMLPRAQQGEVLAARRRVRELEAEMRLPPATPARRDDRELADLLHQARTDLQDLIDDIRQDHPGFMPTGLGLSGILALVPEGGALVAPLVTSQGSVAFVLPEGTRSVEVRHVIPLEGFTGGNLRELLLGSEHDDHLGGWMGAYFAFHEGRTEASFEAWCTAIEATTRQLWEALMAPVHDRLEELGLAQDAPVILMPQGGLGLLPLHAAWREVDGDKRAFLEDYSVYYAPSAYALNVARRRLGEPLRQGASLLTVVNPTGDLRYAQAEGEAVAALFPADDRETLPGWDATREAVRQRVPGRTYLHFSCHGFYHWRDAMASGILLAGRDAHKPDPLSLSEIISGLDLSAARSVTLSACETGLTEFQQSPDEYIGLPAGFLQAGAPAVVSSLWAVDDLSTALLMGRFYYEHLKEGLPPSQALRTAQNWLRKEVDRPYVMGYIQSLLANLQAQHQQASPWSEEQAAIDQQISQLKGQLKDFQEQEKHDPGRNPFDRPFHWAAFTLSGADG